MGSPTNHRPAVPQIIFDNIAAAKLDRLVERETLDGSQSVFTERMFEGDSSGKLRFNDDGSIELIFESSINPQKK